METNCGLCDEFSILYLIARRVGTVLLIDVDGVSDIFDDNVFKCEV